MDSFHFTNAREQRPAFWPARGNSLRHPKNLVASVNILSLPAQDEANLLKVEATVATAGHDLFAVRDSFRCRR